MVRGAAAEVGHEVGAAGGWRLSVQGGYLSGRSLSGAGPPSGDRHSMMSEILTATALEHVTRVKAALEEFLSHIQLFARALHTFG